MSDDIDDVILTCLFCAREPVHAQRCSRCKVAIYCGAECQKAHWKTHRADCKPTCAESRTAKATDADHNTDHWLKVLRCDPENANAWYHTGFAINIGSSETASKDAAGSVHVNGRDYSKK